MSLKDRHSRDERKGEREEREWGVSVSERGMFVGYLSL